MKTSCTIIISHYESECFLHTCIRQTRKMEHSDIDQHIIICDQSSDETANRISKIYGMAKDITIVRTLPLYSGFGLDYIMRNIEIKTDYICQLHVDAFGITPNYIYLCIKLINEYNLSFVGQLQCINLGDSPVYPPFPFFAMAQCFNVARTDTYKVLSLEAGFTRFHNRPQSGLTFQSNDWSEWAKDDYNARGSDDDIVAFHWQDKHTQMDKLGLAITGYIQPSFGRIIESVLFHFGSCREASSNINSMPELYRYYTNKINEDYSDSLIDEMVNLAMANKPPELDILSRNLWSGTKKESSPPSERINKRIEELKSC